jgi:hypothetical protein
MNNFFHCISLVVLSCVALFSVFRIVIFVLDRHDDH